jgi:hypothetical protein
MPRPIPPNPTTQSRACWFLTINVPVVYMAWDVMIFMQENPFRGLLDGWALKIKTFLGPEMVMREASAIWAQKSRDFQDPPLPMAWVMDFPASKSKIPSAIYCKKTSTLVIFCVWVSVALTETFRYLELCSTCLKKGLGCSKPPTNSRTSTLTHCVGFLLYPSLTERLL